MFLTFFLALTTLTINAPEKAVPIKVQVAITEKEKLKGLQEQTFLNEDEGMLFVFDQEGYYPFWMKNTPLCLSLIFINTNYVIVDIKEGEPFSKKIIKGDKPYQYVLEATPYFVQKNQIEKGMQLKEFEIVTKKEESKKES